MASEATTNPVAGEAAAPDGDSTAPKFPLADAADAADASDAPAAAVADGNAVAEGYRKAPGGGVSFDTDVSSVLFFFERESPCI